MNNSGYFVSILLYARLLQIKRSLMNLLQNATLPLRYIITQFSCVLCFPFLRKLLENIDKSSIVCVKTLQEHLIRK